ncbi:MAG TPA: glucose-1-phosphate adenylyltransferase [Actinomycetaceae bacterium]|nr:glucose-1-phosphate adenylyltransferase [Actinomycetaceae bacterium]
MARNPKVLAIVLAGGEGKRLMPLTKDRAKPAVPFGGVYRLIDLVLSNLVNSGFLKIVVLTQYKSHSLDRHISKTWRMSTLLGNYVAPVPAQQRVDKQWFQGSADAIFQSINTIEDEKPDYVVITGADNIFRMDFAQMLERHIETGFPLTLAGIRQPLSLADQFGVIEADADNPYKIGAFREKPTDAVGLEDSPNEVLASMGNYIMTTSALHDAIERDAEDKDSKHDMGGSIVPYFVNQGAAGLYDFIDNEIPGSTARDKDYWRDVGTVDAFYESNMDLISVTPVFNLYNDNWPIYTGYTGLPPAKFVYGHQERLGHALDSIVSPGVVVSGGEVMGSVLSPHVRVNSWSSVRNSVVFDGVEIGRNATVNRAILDKNVVVEEGAQVGIDPEYDAERGFTVTEGGIVVVPKGSHIKR